MEKNLGKWDHSWATLKDPRGYGSIDLEKLEYILPTRLMDDTFSGIMNFIIVNKVDTPRDQIQKALVSYVCILHIFESIFQTPKLIQFFHFQ